MAANFAVYRPALDIYKNETQMFSFMILLEEVNKYPQQYDILYVLAIENAILISSSGLKVDNHVGFEYSKKKKKTYVKSQYLCKVQYRQGQIGNRCQHLRYNQCSIKIQKKTVFVLNVGFTIPNNLHTKPKIYFLIYHHSLYNHELLTQSKCVVQEIYQGRT